MLILFQACALIPVLIVTAKMLKSKNKANEKALRGAKTLRAGCTKAEPKKGSPRRRPPSRGRGKVKIQSAGDGHYLHLQTQFGEDRCTQFRVIVVTDPHRPPVRHRQGRLQYTAPQLSAQCKDIANIYKDRYHNATNHDPGHRSMNRIIITLRASQPSL